MRTVSADARETSIKSLIEAAQIEPVALLEEGGPRAILVSTAEYDRLSREDRIRSEIKERLLRSVAELQAEAAANGLTEEELEEILADAS